MYNCTPVLIHVAGDEKSKMVVAKPEVLIFQFPCKISHGNIYIFVDQQHDG